MMTQLRTFRPPAYALAAATLLVTAGCGEDMDMVRDQVVVRDSMAVVVSETGDLVLIPTHGALVKSRL